MPKPSAIIDTQVTPDPVLEKRVRRTFSADYKLKIIQLADVCQHGELGPLLRKEKLYANQLSQWRREFAEQGIAGLSKSTSGPKPAQSPEQRRITQLEREISKLNQQIAIKDSCLDLQKKALEMLEQWNSEPL